MNSHHCSNIFWEVFLYHSLYHLCLMTLPTLLLSLLYISTDLPLLVLVQGHCQPSQLVMVMGRCQPRELVMVKGRCQPRELVMGRCQLFC